MLNNNLSIDWLKNKNYKRKKDRQIDKNEDKFWFSHHFVYI